MNERVVFENDKPFAAFFAGNVCKVSRQSHCSRELAFCWETQAADPKTANLVRPSSSQFRRPRYRVGELGRQLGAVQRPIAELRRVQISKRGEAHWHTQVTRELLGDIMCELAKGASLRFCHRFLNNAQVNRHQTRTAVTLRFEIRFPSTATYSGPTKSFSHAASRQIRAGARNMIHIWTRATRHVWWCRHEGHNSSSSDVLFLA